MGARDVCSSRQGVWLSVLLAVLSAAGLACLGLAGSLRVKSAFKPDRQGPRGVGPAASVVAGPTLRTAAGPGSSSVGEDPAPWLHREAAREQPSALRRLSGDATGKSCEWEVSPSIGSFWDASCRYGVIGCNADGKHRECRFCGPAPFVPCPTTTVTTTTTATSTSTSLPTHKACSDVFSDVAFNPLRQKFPDNPDSSASGFVFCRFCSSGRVSCNATVFGGRTRIIASHIHLASNGDGSTGFGHPVFNMCGENSRGFINDGTPYASSCSGYQNGAAAMVDLEGTLVRGGVNEGMTAADRVRDILARPHRYYFNFHSVASWAYFRSTPKHEGMCRGALGLSGQDFAVARAQAGRP
eukprot:CAMPEP_0197876182 /NCGR_PEP_ID=MMETSP1439-20131203/5226_1 /TAXON_ID=66791 /ORGANISM="Gonyaulax spinifera, Strain CCMP409" /LENGTH=354 /DNA_ID=CAMNT_0043495455 /DNA_START=49 /DNA_END=1113 /DNA_ORIENTATION=-